MTQQKTKIEIIDFVVEHIKRNGRAVVQDEHNGQECVYYSTDGKRCGHSICIDDNMAKQVSGTAAYVIITNGDDIHKPEFRGNGIEFWRKIQFLHDHHLFWENNELTEKGTNYVNNLKEEYAENQT